MSGGSELRVAMALRLGATEEWHRLCVDRMRALRGVSVAGAIVFPALDTPLPASSDEGSRTVALEAIVGDLPTAAMNPNPAKSGSTDLRGLDAVDAIVDLSHADTGVWQRQRPRFGVWRYGFGDGAPVAAGAPGTLARLYRLSPDRERAVVLREGWYRAQTADAPGTRSVLQRVAPWCARVLAQLREGDEGVVSAAPQPVAECDEPRPRLRAAGWRQEAAGAFDRWVRRERWTIGILPVGIDELLQRGTLPEPRWIVGQPADRYFADPFPLRRSGDCLQILAEEYPYRTGRGRVAELDIGTDARLLGSRSRIASAEHASYPFVLRREGAMYCIPETAREGRVAAFACDSSEADWKVHAQLLDGFPAVDSTLLERDGRWWLFCTHRDEENQTELHIFSASDWLGPWAPHPRNPVKCDARSSRPGGACFIIDGEVYRPAQDCSRRYGGALAINRILELSERQFREETVLTLRPSPNSAWPDGVHTINTLDTVTVIDGLRVERTRRRT